MSTPQEYLHKIGLIVGDDISDGEVNLHLSWNNYSEAKALLTRIRTIQKEMRLLKKDVSATISAIKSEFTTARTNVGKSFGAGLAAGLFGRRTMGRVNSAQRDDLRRNQINAVEPYERVKRIIDNILHQLDTIKGQIELSPEYQIRTPQASPAKPPQLPPPLPARPTRRFFAFIAEQVKGPYTVEQLQALHDASTITDDTQCCPEGTEEWQSYSHVIA
jgi:hypothetical protein